MISSDQLIEFGFIVSLIANAFVFIPQIISLVRCKSAEGISLFTFAGFNIIQIFTILHGFIAQDYLLAWGFLLSFFTCGGVTFLIIYYRYLVKT